MSSSEFRSSKALVFSLALAATAGWGWALSQHFGTGAEPAAEAVDAAPSPAPVADMPANPAGDSAWAGLLPTERSAKLIARMADIAAAAKPGEPNQALIDACRETLTDGDAERRRRDFALLLDLMRAEDGPAVHELFVELHREGRAYGAYNLFAIRWGEVDCPGAIGYLQVEQPLRMPARDVVSILFGWGQTDPEAALEWLEENPKIRMGYDGTTQVLKGWMRRDLDAATRYVLNEGVQPGPVIESIRFAAGEVALDQGGIACAEWIGALPEGGIQGHAALLAWDAVRWGFNEMPYETGARVWSEVGGKPWMDFDRFESFGASLAGARVNDEGVAGFANALSLAWPLEEALPQFRRWYQREPEKVTNWLENMPATEWVAELQEAVVGENDPLRIR